MPPTKHPLIDLVVNDETARYIAMLERKLNVLNLENIRFRTILELLTDEDWEDTSFNAEDKELRLIAIDALKRRLGLSDTDARNLVTERWGAHNPPDPSEGELLAAKTYMVGKSPTPHIVTHARPIGTVGPSFDMEKHLAGLGKIRDRREMAKMENDRPERPL